MKMMTRCGRSRLLILLVMMAWAIPAQAQKLIDLIPSLYGGDGISLATAPAASHTAHFSIESAASINRLNQQIAAEIGGFPFSSSVGGFAFEFDPILGDFVSTSSTLGPVIAERAATQGEGRLNFNFSFTYLSYSEFSGEGLGSIDVVTRHDPDIVGFPDVLEQFEQDEVHIDMDVDISVQLLALAGTYGITDRIDVGVLLPYALVDLDVATLAVVEQSQSNTLFPGIHSFDDGPEAAADGVSGNASGMGDIVLRGKMHLLETDQTQVALATLLQFGTGDNDDFLGTGETAIRPFLILSRTIDDRFTPHINLGYEFNLDRSEHSALEYAIGFDLGSSRYTVAADLLGSHELDGDGLGDDIVDATLGAKWNPFGRVIAAVNARVPLNDAGLRSALTTTVSVEYGF
ncbi:MAG: hypothetical protein HOI33_11325 [Rhodospirillaceae bacterium]|jgi:hypothetical protein|nr:hypothetical protein [Rhodospirillaceae bacterium]